MEEKDTKKNKKPLPRVVKIIMRIAEIIFAILLICILIFDINLILDTLNFPSGFIFLIWAFFLMIEVPFVILFGIAVIIFEVLFYKDRKLQKIVKVDDLDNVANTSEIKSGE